MKESSFTTRKRLKVGRAQKRSASAYKLMGSLRKEIALWALILLSFSVHLLLFIKAENSVSRIFPSEIDKSITLLTTLTIATIYAFIFGRILLNLIVHETLKWGMKNDKHFSNSFITVLNFVITIPILAVFWYVAIAFHAPIMASLAELWEMAKTLKDSEANAAITPGNPSSAGNNVIIPFKIKAIIAALIVDVLLNYILFILLLITLIFNMSRTVINFVNSLNLLPSQRILNNELRIKNYHYSDIEELQAIYLGAKNSENPNRTYRDADFEQYMKDNDSRYIRVLLEQGSPIGFYLTTPDRSVLRGIMIRPTHRGKNLHQELLKDFERCSRGIFVKEIKAKFPSKDTKTIDFLKDNGWVESPEEREEDPIQPQSVFLKTLTYKENQ